MKSAALTILIVSAALCSCTSRSPLPADMQPDTTEAADSLPVDADTSLMLHDDIPINQ